MPLRRRLGELTGGIALLRSCRATSTQQNGIIGEAKYGTSARCHVAVAYQILITVHAAAANMASRVAIIAHEQQPSKIASCCGFASKITIMLAAASM